MRKPEREWRIRRGDLRRAVAARHEFTRYLGAKAAGDAERYDASLIFGELVANAVKCARTSVSVELVENEWTWLRVSDDGDCFDEDRIAPQPIDAQSGRGLYIANRLARRLNIAREDRRCVVTAELPIRS
jgi:anti-sigma regulatory factor (Ser/Thr protein kinase)